LRVNRENPTNFSLFDANFAIFIPTGLKFAVTGVIINSGSAGVGAPARGKKPVKGVEPQ
jgi:hypothetical protein